MVFFYLFIKLTGVPDGSRILMTTVSQFWNGRDWIIPLPLQQVNHFFEHIMIR